MVNAPDHAADHAAADNAAADHAAADRAARHAVAEAGLSRATVADTLRIARTVLAPMVARGAILRRRRVMALAERLDADRRAVALLQRMRARYGPGPLVLRVPGRPVAVVLSPDHLGRVLRESPEPFTPANQEKRGALTQFQPDGVLVSHGRARVRRRELDEAVLDTDRPVHRLAAALVAVAGEEARRLLDGRTRLAWPDFEVAWRRLARRVVLGDGAADDSRLTDELTALRRAANWSSLRPRRRFLRRRFLRRLARHVDRAGPGSLAGLLAAASTALAPESAARHGTARYGTARYGTARYGTARHAAARHGTARYGTAATEAGAAPAGQVPHWLFAFDAAGVATWQAAALLASHPEAAAWAADELAGRDLATPQDLPYLRACVLDAVRLWPTTMVVLRDATAATAWDGGTLPAGTAFVLVSSYFHRAAEFVAHADRFAPEAWLDADEGDTWPMIPFGAGPAACAGRNLVLLLASAMLARLLQGRELRLVQARGQRPLDPEHPLPGTIDPFRLAFRVEVTDAGVDGPAAGQEPSR